MQVTEATIHRLIKSAQTNGTESVTQKLRTAALPIDATLQAVSDDLLALYAKTANNNGTLGTNPTTHVFPVKLRDYLDGNLVLQDFTSAALDLIGNEMQKSFMANGGYALFLRYSQTGSDFFLIAMLKLKPGASIDEQSMDLEPTLTIDMNLLNEAARVNITRWDSGEEPYLTFIKGRARQGEVTDYFRDALACTSYTKSSHHTEHVIKAADAFVDDLEGLSEDEKKQRRIEVHQRLHRTFTDNSEEVRLLTLAASIHPEAPEDFVDYVQCGNRADEFQIDDAFKPHKATYKRLQRFTVTMGTVSVGFSVDDVQSGRVYYDEGEDEFVVKSPSTKLRQVVSDNAPQTS